MWETRTWSVPGHRSNDRKPTLPRRNRAGCGVVASVPLWWPDLLPPTLSLADNRGKVKPVSVRIQGRVILTEGIAALRRATCLTTNGAVARPLRHFAVLRASLQPGMEVRPWWDAPRIRQHRQKACTITSTRWSRPRPPSCSWPPPRPPWELPPAQAWERHPQVPWPPSSPGQRAACAQP